MNYEEKFRERGLTPFEPILNHKQRVECVDKEGYKYSLSYHDHIADLRTKEFSKWSKKNPFKPYNMRLFASKLQSNVQILSSDEELKEATHRDVRFLCPLCGEEYEKKWCHWITQPINRHYCQKCSNAIAVENRKYSYKEIMEYFNNRGFKLLEKEENFDCGGGHRRLYCQDSEGYKYDISLNSLKSGNSGNNKFSSTNPYAVYNLQKSCDDNDLQLKIVEQIANSVDSRSCFIVRCRCGNLYNVEPYEILSLNRYRCLACSKKESRLELLTREWLEKNNIVFQAQYRFPDCKHKRSLPFDFRCDWKGRIILLELDGGQHYYITQWTDENDLKDQQMRDKIKNDYAKEKGYTLIRIPFWLFNSGSYVQKLEKIFNS